MKVLNLCDLTKISGGDVTTALSYVAIAGVAAVIVGIEAYLIQLARDDYEAIDFSKLTPKEAYDLGVSHTYMYCRAYI